jgi:hypothetical protein
VSRECHLGSRVDRLLGPRCCPRAGPPDSSATGYRVELAWSGSDPDGTIDHYDWILADHPAARDSIADVVVTVPAAGGPRWR